MRFSAAAFVAAALAFQAVAQGVTSAIAPDAPAPSGCADSYDGTFMITVAAVTSKKLLKRQNDFQITLTNGVLTDQLGRTGYIAANNQFQFDNPPQAGAIYTAGFSVCGNGSLALGDSAIWYECQSGAFFNLYNKDWAAQCNACYIDIIGENTGASTGPTTTTTPISTEASSSSPPGITIITAVSQSTNSQPIATTTTATPVSEGSSGQPVAPSTASEVSRGSSATTSSGPSSGASASTKLSTVTSTASGALSGSSGGLPHVTGSAGSNSTISTPSVASSASSASAASSAKSTFSAAAIPLRAGDAMMALAGAAAFAIF